MNSYSPFASEINYVTVEAVRRERKLNANSLSEGEIFRQRISELRVPDAIRSAFSWEELVELRDRLAFTLVPGKDPVRDVDIINAAEVAVARRLGGEDARQQLRRERAQILYDRWMRGKGDWYGDGNMYASLGALLMAHDSVLLSRMPRLEYASFELRVPHVRQLVEAFVDMERPS